MSAGRSSSRGKGLRPHQPLREPSSGTGTLPGQEVDLEGQHGKQRWACLSHTWGDRCDRVCLGSQPGWDLTLENRWPSESS